MPRTRRTLIRGVIAAAAIAAPAAPPPAKARPKRAATRTKRDPAIVIDPNRFAHFSTPEAAAQFRAWQANVRRDDDD